jgi:hypothetical protein
MTICGAITFAQLPSLHEGEERFANGWGASAHFNHPHSVVVAANGDIFVSYRDNHTIRVITPQGAVRTLCDSNGEKGFADAQGAAEKCRRAEIACARSLVGNFPPYLTNITEKGAKEGLGA